MPPMPRRARTRDQGIFTHEPAGARDDDLVAHQSVGFTCPRGHEFTVHFADDVTPPAGWECRKHSIMPRPTDGDHPDQTVKKRSHWDMVLERRPETELEQILAEQLKALRAGQLMPVDQRLKQNANGETQRSARRDRSSDNCCTGRQAREESFRATLDCADRPGDQSTAPQRNSGPTPTAGIDANPATGSGKGRRR